MSFNTCYEAWAVPVYAKGHLIDGNECGLANEVDR